MFGRRSSQKRAHDGRGRQQQLGMLADAHWALFTSDSDDYEFGDQVGFGASSTVYAAVCRPRSARAVGAEEHEGMMRKRTDSSATARPTLRLNMQTHHHDGSADKQVLRCAIKVSSAHADIAQLAKEIKLLSLSRHPNVLRILVTFTLPPEHQRICIVMPLIDGGSLAGILDWRARMSSDEGPQTKKGGGRLKGKHAGSDSRTLDEEEVRAVVKQVLEGLVYLHSHGFLHRDLKASNLLVASDGTILLADFGVGGDLLAASSTDQRLSVEAIRFARPVSVPVLGLDLRTVKTPKKRISFVGTPGWMAPEVILEQEHDAKADIWSLGVTIIELATGTVTNSVTYSLLPDYLSARMREFVAACLARDPASRPAASQLLSDAWLRHARAKDFLADSLLADLPPIAARQEIRRMPSIATPSSPSTPWNFDPSAPNSPLRSMRSVPRSPSAVSTERAGYFPSVSPARSRLSGYPVSLPPSPRVALRQRTNKSPPSDAIRVEDLERLKVRSPSEGQVRSRTSAG